jgi:hypothetical protein
MDGLFVDNNSCLYIIYDTYLNKNEHTLQVACANNDIEDFKGYVGTLNHKLKNTVELRANEKILKGKYNGSDCISWNNGMEWKRLKVSSEQIYMLKTRPYIPMTIVLLHFLYSFISNCSIKSRCKFTSMFRNN